jgi:uncharacterized protein
MPLKAEQESYTHEDYTAAIISNSTIKDLIESDSYNSSNYGIMAKEVAGLIEEKPFPTRNLFWKVLISSQLDADRGDYLLRDSHHIGVKYGIYDHLRLINTLSLGIEPESDEIVLGIDEDSWHVAESLVIARYQMFVQVYFHKTVRAYQYHLEEAMKSALSDGKLPKPDDLASFIKLDDTDMWKRFKDSSFTNDNSRSILERDHIRLVYSTPETPSPDDETKKEEIKMALISKGVWVHEDNKAQKSWYKLNDPKEKFPEIMIIKDRKARPLSDYSLIVKNMKDVNQIRLYVKPNDRDRAKGIIDDGKYI